jgi:hypothetical protein
MTRMWARELASRGTVNAINPRLLCSNGGGLVYGTCHLCQWQNVDGNLMVSEIEYMSAVASKARNQCIPPVFVSSYKPPSLAI